MPIEPTAVELLLERMRFQLKRQEVKENDVPPENRNTEYWFELHYANNMLQSIIQALQEAIALDKKEK